MKNDKQNSKSITEVLFDPSSSLWLSIILYMVVFLEMTVFFGTIALVVLGHTELKYLGYAVVGIIFYHVFIMLSLNMVFNIQNIKNNTEKIYQLINNKN
ncbi:hypothetical protein [Liberiplasma polymorphum]|uniref:hypothetical protein n=1 Tax=Liberiplasma polymorphum TaxID=3374570 RepID=UPI0037740336